MSDRPSKVRITENEDGSFNVHLPDGHTIPCQTRVDAELILSAVLQHYEGNTERKLPRETLAALERTGRSAVNSMLYRSVMHRVADE